MKEYLISQFLDNGLNLDEKEQFVESVRHDEFHKETIELIQQEKLLRSCMVAEYPEPSKVTLGQRFRLFFFAYHPACAGFTLAMLIIAAIFTSNSRDQVIMPAEYSHIQHRFVLYLPDADSTSLVGNFSNWEPIPMQKVDDSGYWTTNVNLSPGEYRYSYLTEEGKKIADPTILDREYDDFGGENTVISIGTAI